MKIQVHGGKEMMEIVQTPKKSLLMYFQNGKCGDFPGGPVVKNLPCNAGDAGLIPGQGTKIPHALRQLSLSVTSIEPKHHTKKLPHDPTKIPPQPSSK